MHMLYYTLLQEEMLAYLYQPSGTFFATWCANQRVLHAMHR